MAPPEHTSEKQACYSFIDPGNSIFEAADIFSATLFYYFDIDLI